MKFLLLVTHVVYYLLQRYKKTTYEQIIHHCFFNLSHPDMFHSMENKKRTFLFHCRKVIIFANEKTINLSLPVR